MKITFPSIITSVCVSWVFLAATAKAGPCTNTVYNNLDNGPGSLRDALANATDFETITFCPGVTGTIKLTSGQLAISNGVTIVGPGANVLALDGNGSNGVFYVSSGLPVSISGLTITNGYNTNPGGGIHNQQSPLTLSNCVVTGNYASYGGGIYNSMQGSELLQIYNCTLSGNRAGNGGALYNDVEGDASNSEVHIYNSTISGNSSDAEGGAIFNLGCCTAVGTIKILNSTLSGNSAGLYGDGIFNDAEYGGSAIIDIGSTILNATAWVNYGGTIQSLGYNLSSDNGGGFLTTTGDQINTDPMLGPLQLNGGQTPTHALLSGSPAIDAGTNFSGLASEQRGPGFARTLDIKLIPNAADGTDIGAFELPLPPSAPAITSTNSVTFITGYSNSFRIEATGPPTPAIYATGTLPGGIHLSTNGILSGTRKPGSGGIFPLTVIASNGVPPMATQYFTLTVVEPCNTVQNNQDSGPGSLRYALANATNFETITFCPGVTGTIKLTSGQLTVDKGVTIVGPGANVLALDGNGSDRVFYVSSGLPVSISGFTITNGYVGGYGTGGGIDNDRSPLTVSNCVISGNYAYDGGGIYNYGFNGGGLLEIYNCTLSGNSAIRGGALENDAEGAGGDLVVHIYNSTVSGNSSAAFGAAIYNLSDLSYGLATIRIVNSTLSGNYGYGIYNNASVFGGIPTIDIGSTILNATALVNTGGTIQSLGYNLSSDNGGGFLTATGDQINTDPMLGPLQLNGGQTPTHALLIGSPAIDAGTNFSGLASDQRGSGFARTLDIQLIPNVANGTDIGAFEVQGQQQGRVTTGADSGLGSLRQVAGALQSGTVTFAPILSGQTITLTSGEIAITNNLTIDASALANGIIINGNHNSRIFNIRSNAAVTLNALVLTNGYTTNNNWGGAILNAGTLALNYCTLAGNSGGDSSVPGGAIANQGSLTVLGCMFSGNSATEAGAIYNFRSTCTLLNSTFYGNIAFGGYGGALENLFGSTLSLSQCTFSSNSASLGGGIDNFQSQLNVTNSILSGNSGQDIFNFSSGTIDAEGANIIPALGNLGTLVGGGTISSADPLLGPLTNNGGRTLSMMPQLGSPAIDAGVTSLAAGLAYDQRGPSYPRVLGTAVDIGALEHDAPPMIVITSPINVTFLTGLSNSFTLTAAGALAPTIAVAGTFPTGVSFTPPATLSGTPPDGSGGAWPLLVTATNAISPNATQHLTVNIVERKVFAAHPSFNTNGLGWALNGDTVNGGPQITNSVFTLTDGTSGENRSAWFRYPLYVGAFEASFTYQDVGGYGADGVGFVIQNDPRGPAALGLAGGGLAYAGITSSVALLLNIYPGAPGGPSGLMLGTNGVGAYDASGALSGMSYQSTAPVNLDAGNPIAVSLRYIGGILQVNLSDTVTSANFQTNIPVNIPMFVGTNVGWVGITGSEGGVLSHQTVSNFSYVPLPVLLSNNGSGSTVNLSWPASIYGYHLQSTSNLLGNVWADLPAAVTQTNGFNLATVPATGNSQFFRLVLPP